MGRQVLLFCTMMLGRIERPILHNVNIHQPIQVRHAYTHLSLSLILSHVVMLSCIAGSSVYVWSIAHL